MGRRRGGLYDGLEHRRSSQDAFYGSAEWRQGPRDRILPFIETYTSIVIEMDHATADSLRGRGGSGA